MFCPTAKTFIKCEFICLLWGSKENIICINCSRKIGKECVQFILTQVKTPSHLKIWLHTTRALKMPKVAQTLGWLNTWWILSGFNWVNGMTHNQGTFSILLWMKHSDLTSFLMLKLWPSKKIGPFWQYMSCFTYQFVAL